MTRNATPRLTLGLLASLLLVGCASTPPEPALRGGRNARSAAQAQLDLINREMTAQIEKMTPEEKQRFIVVVSGAHQARAENLWMQYLAQLMGKEAIAGERRRVYAEAVYDRQGALNLLGMHVMDRSIGEAFFDSPTRMQRDLLGHATREILPSLDIPKLSP